MKGHTFPLTGRDSRLGCKERFRINVEGISIALWKTDVNGRRTFLNRPWLDYGGLHLEQEESADWVDEIHPEDRQGVLEAVAQSFDSRLSFRISYRQRQAGDGYRWVSDSGEPWFTAEGAFAGYIGWCAEFQGES